MTKIDWLLSNYEQRSLLWHPRNKTDSPVFPVSANPLCLCGSPVTVTLVSGLQQGHKCLLLLQEVTPSSQKAFSYKHAYFDNFSGVGSSLNYLSETPPPAQPSLNFSLLPWLWPWRGWGMQGSLPIVGNANLVSEQRQKERPWGKIVPMFWTGAHAWYFTLAHQAASWSAGRSSQGSQGVIITRPEQLLASDSKKNLKHRKARLMSLRPAQVMVWNKSAWSNAGHTENLQVIIHNDYSERELASK